MNELSPPPAKKPRTFKALIGVMLVMAAVSGLGYYASQAGLDKALVEQQLNAWIERTKKQAQEQGQSLDIRYSDVAIKGGLTDGHALISNLEIINSTEQGKNRITIAQIRLEPNSADLSNVGITLLTPVHVFEGNNSFESASLLSTPPLHFTVEQIEQKSEDYTRISHQLPRTLTLRFLVGKDASGEEEKPQILTPRYDTIDITMGKKSYGVLTTHHSRADLGDSTLHIHDLKIVPVGNEVGAITVESLQTSWKNSLNDKQINVIEISAALKKLHADEKFISFTPVNASLKLHFEGAMPQSPEALAALQSAQTLLKLDEFNIITKDASLNATADFVANKDDILPIGMANISAKNVQSWRELLKQYNVLRPKDELLVNTLLIHIAGQTLPNTKDLSIDIKRAHEGTFQIGAITLEEVLAIILGNVTTPLDTKLPEPTEQAAPIDTIKTE